MRIMQIHDNANQDREFEPRLECLMHRGARLRDVARLGDRAPLAPIRSHSPLASVRLCVSW